VLIIGRRIGESIFLGPDVEVRIIELSHSRVTIGIVAPRQLSIMRGEMKLAAEQNRVASQPASPESLARLVGHIRSSNTGPPHP